MVRGQLLRLRGGPPEAPRQRGRPAAPHPLQATRPALNTPSSPPCSAIPRVRAESCEDSPPVRPVLSQPRSNLSRLHPGAAGNHVLAAEGHPAEQAFTARGRPAFEGREQVVAAILDGCSG